MLSIGDVQAKVPHRLHAVRKALVDLGKFDLGGHRWVGRERSVCYWALRCFATPPALRLSGRWEQGDSVTDERADGCFRGVR